MLLSSDPTARARWEVLFVYRGKVCRKKFGTNLPDAISYLTKAMAKGPLLNSVTLRCTNMGFPPPEKLRPHEKLARRPGRKKPVPVRVVPMNKLNRERGIWWCPYCMKLRKFVRRTHAMVDGIQVADKAECCPMCGVSHRDHHVRRWNPVAVDLTAREAA